MADKLKQGFDNYGEYWQVSGNEKKFRNKEDALKIGHKVEPTKKLKPKSEERMKPIEISPERKKADEALSNYKMDAKRLAIRDIKKKFPEGHKAVVEKAKENKTGQKDVGKSRKKIVDEKGKLNRYQRYGVPETMWDDDEKAEQWIVKHSKNK